MRILLISLLHPLPTNPARGMFVADRIELLRSMGHDVKVVNPLPRMLKANEARRSTLTGVAKAPRTFDWDGLEVFSPRFIRLPQDPLPALTSHSVRRITRKVIRWLGDWRPDVISCHTIWPVGVLAKELSDRWGIPWYATIHGHDLDVGIESGIGNRLAGLSSSADRLVVVSDRLVKLAEQHGIEAEVIPCHAEVGPEWAQSIRRFTGRWRRGRLEVLFPADPRRPEKRHVLALKACTELEQRGWNVHIGTLKQVPRDLVWDRMVTCDIGLITSSRESGPLVAREAILCGLPIASVDVGDLSSWLPDGCISKSDDPASLADVVEDILSGGVADPTIPERFSRTAVMTRLDSLLSDLVAERIGPELAREEDGEETQPDCTDDT